MVFKLIKITEDIERQEAEFLLNLIDKVCTVLHVHLSKGNGLLQQVCQEFPSDIHSLHAFKYNVTIYKRNNLSLRAKTGINVCE